MKKSYLFAPLIAILAFALVYANFRSGHKDREKAREEQVAAAKAEKLKQENDARKAALADAIVFQEARKKEREAKAAVEKTEREARQVALDARDKAFRDQDKFTKQIERQKKEIAAEKEALAKIEETKKAAVAEQTFLSGYVTKTEANAKALGELLTKIDAAEASRASAASAEVGKKNS